MVLQSILNGKTKTITAAAVIIAGSSLASRLLGVIRDRLLVGTFGVGDQLDSYYASFQVPNFIFNLLILGTLSVAFIPIFIDYWSTDDAQEAWCITNTIFNSTAILMSVLCLLLALFAPTLTTLVAPGFEGEKFARTISLTRFMLLSPLLFSLSAVMGSVLNATKRFLSVAIAPVLYNGAIIASIIFLSPRWGIWGVAIGVVIGATLHFFLQLAAAIAVGYRYRFVLNLRHPAVRTFARLFIPRIWGIDVSQISLLIGSIIGSTFAVGSVAIFNLAVNIESVPIGIIAIPFVLAAFPNLTEAVAQKKLPQFVEIFSYATRQILFFLMPISALTIVLRAHVVRLIIGTRELSWDDTRLAAAALGIFAVGFLAQGLTPLFSRAFYALKDTVRPVFVNVASIIVNLIITVLVVGALERGGVWVETVKHVMRLDGIPDIRVLSLPIGFTVATIANMGMLAVWLSLRFGSMAYSTILWRALPISIASLGGGAAAYATLNLMTPLVNTHTFVGIFGQMAVATVMGVLVYGFLSLVFKSKEMWQFLRSLERRMVRLVGPVDVSGVEEL